LFLFKVPFFYVLLLPAVSTLYRYHLYAIRPANMGKLILSRTRPGAKVIINIFQSIGLKAHLFSALSAFCLYLFSLGLGSVGGHVPRRTRLGAKETVLPLFLEFVRLNKKRLSAISTNSFYWHITILSIIGGLNV